MAARATEQQLGVPSVVSVYINAAKRYAFVEFRQARAVSGNDEGRAIRNLRWVMDDVVLMRVPGLYRGTKAGP